MSSPVTRFMRQQGFAEEAPLACDLHFAGLLFQPRLVFPLVLTAIAAQLVSLPLSAVLHLLVAAVLCWNTFVPALNPFERAYNRWFTGAGGVRLGPAPAPRRFAQGMAAAFNLGAGLGLLLGAAPLAWLMQAFLIVGFSALLFGRFCLGAYVYHVLRGRVDFANQTLPWAQR